MRPLKVPSPVQQLFPQATHPDEILSLIHISEPTRPY